MDDKETVISEETVAEVVAESENLEASAETKENKAEKKKGKKLEAEIAELNKKLEAKDAEIKELNDKYTRMYAEYDNFHKNVRGI